VIRVGVFNILLNSLSAIKAPKIPRRIIGLLNPPSSPKYCCTLPIRILVMIRYVVVQIMIRSNVDIG